MNQYNSRDIIREAYAGNKDAQFKLATSGWLPADYQLKWLREAANRGHLKAICRVASMCDDDREIFAWRLKAAELGHTKSQNIVGKMYFFGRGVKQDYSKAFVWSKQCAEQGMHDAIYRIGWMYFFGKGVERNIEKGMMFLSEAIKLGNVDAILLLARIYFDGKYTDKNIEKAFKLYMEAASQGNMDAQYCVGCMMLTGDGVCRNEVEGVSWILKSSKNGLKKAVGLISIIRHIESKRVNNGSNKFLADEIIKNECEKIVGVLVTFGYIKADEYYNSIDEIFRNRIQYQDLIKKCRILESSLEKYDFIEADKLNVELVIPNYETLKDRYVKEWFEKEVTEGGDKKPYCLDNEQTLAVLNTNKNTLVAARAGSGKTLTLVAKIIYLMAKYNVKSNEILTFVFNANAKNEINNRLQAIIVDNNRLLIDSEIGRTFHSFAYHVVVDVCQHTKPIILQGRERTKFIKSIIAAFVDKEEIYRYFRSEALRIERKQFKSEEQYYNTIRNCRYQTLDGHQVKSEAEKIIADYLFEHDIDYYYENEYVIGDFYPFCKESDRQRLYDLKNKFEEEYIKPDFYLPEYELFWEHWAITGEETNNEINDINSGGYIGDYQFYKDKMNWKKWFYGKSWLNRDVVVKSHKMFTQIFDMRGLIETYRSLAMTREEFENYIEQKLQQVGINKCRLPTKTLIEKVWDKQITTFNKLVEQFIDRTQQSYFRDDKELKQKIEGDFDERTKSFYNIAWRCYEKYQDYFAGKWTDEELESFEEFSIYNVDYNLLMKQAIGFIEDKRPEVIDDLSCKKYILIDEYQDFNKLFYEMLKGIRSIVPDAKLFVVGDNWQAINRFMGADTYYFDSFELVFPDDVARLEISTNYRCATNVIEYAKTFVSKHMGCENNYQASNVECGAAGVVSYDDEQRNKIIEMIQKPEGKLYIDSTIVKAGKNGKLVLNNKFIWYLKKVASIIHQNSNAQKFVILHRNNNTSFYGISQDEFLKRLNMVMVRNRWMSEDEFRQKISIMTIHRAKGLQADVVILLEADAGVIPSFNPNSLLFTVFGENAETVLKDEKNLFYVAITRAKQKLYILHDAMPSGKNGFLEGMHDCVS